MFTPDAPITNVGRSQSLQAGLDLTKEIGNDSYTVIVSPLRRALQTARHMLSTTETQPSQIIVHAAAAEVMVDACDIGSSVSDIKKEFPEFDFGDLQDCWWAFGRSLAETWPRMKKRLPGGAETDEMIQARLDQLKAYIRNLDEPRIVVVVCHSDVIWELTKETKQGEVFGIKARNAEIHDITSFIL